MNYNNNKSSDLINDCKLLGSIIGEKNRLKIIMLLKHQELPATKINRALHLPQNIISHHLITLTKKGALSRRHEGRFIYYSLNKKNLKKLINSLKDLI